ncbi:MAG: TIGR01777 family oxidoreductase [Microbacter sp.]
MQEHTKPLIVLAGGSGFIGRHAASFFTQIGYRVAVLTRAENHYADAIRYVHWDGKTVENWKHLLNESVAVFNFTGQNIQSLPTAANRNEILQSRVLSIKALTNAILQCEKPPKIFVQMSAVGFYGDSKEICTETTPSGKGFLAETCVQWEQAFLNAALPKTRKIIFRLGMVLAADGGAFPLFVKLTKSFLGSAVGSGKQGVSWIHINDLMQMFRCTLYRSDMEGIYNATSTHPISNEEFMKTLRQKLFRPWIFNVPAVFAAKTALWILKVNPEVILTGCFAIPQRLTESGCLLQFNTFDDALNDLLYRG